MYIKKAVYSKKETSPLEINSTQIGNELNNINMNHQVESNIENLQNGFKSRGKSNQKINSKSTFGNLQNKTNEIYSNTQDNNVESNFNSRFVDNGNFDNDSNQSLSLIHNKNGVKKERKEIKEQINNNGSNQKRNSQPNQWRTKKSTENLPNNKSLNNLQKSVAPTRTSYFCKRKFLSNV